MGIGDLLRSSAAWQALKLRWPLANLYLLMLSRHPGYPTEQLIQGHHLLEDAVFVRVADSTDSKHKRPHVELRKEVLEKYGAIPFDLVIDCEPHGMRTTLLARWIARAWSAPSVGIAQFPTRGWFYDYAAASTRSYVRSHQLPVPMDYTERDFVALAALGIERDGGAIVLAVSEAGLAWQQQHLTAPAGTLRVTLNIGCGTLDALPKRPPMQQLIANMVALRQSMAFELHLSGATFEEDVNAQFAMGFTQRLAELGLPCLVKDWAGRSSLSELTGLLGASGLVISTDSGPYHMAVALGVPTVCWFNFETPASLHNQKGVRAVVTPTPQEFVAAAREVSGLT
jgi:ADP-heptose:LPS heptosyltransferase